MTKFLILGFLLVMPVMGFSAKTDQEVKFLMNHGYGSVAQLGSELVNKKEQVLRGTWDYSVVGGASGSISLKGPDGSTAALPNNAIVTDCLIDVITAPLTGDSFFPKIAIGTGETTTDLKLVAATSSYTGRMACIPVGTAATAIKLTAARTPVLHIATVSTTPTASLTAGKINVFIKYLIGD